MTKYAVLTEYATTGSAPGEHDAACGFSAAGVVLVVPALLATILVQRGFVRGLTFGAVKQ